MNLDQDKEDIIDVNVSPQWAWADLQGVDGEEILARVDQDPDLELENSHLGEKLDEHLPFTFIQFLDPEIKQTFLSPKSTHVSLLKSMHQTCMVIDVHLS